ncbi:exonuclease subunit SbcD [Salibacterium halotolerans]|uniref:Nuclease SbcCD subunit D n=1 Tax=Salibacterium halotolerans TaxID=1884432 RepID=A0A1I5QEB7_9BACI|nr:exonuclease SbcCD subunit D C-terminal domain-containing protein [Salibacterium halotolerans]SFP44649.1 exonuclease SbcD [Salibacterium halotolerans]
MRILHTADWHIGRTLEGRSRMAEHTTFLEELELIIQEEKADVLLIAGDVFDSVNPPADAESLFYETMARISSRFDIPVAVIAGNHDHPERLEAPRRLAKAQNIHILGYPGREPLHIPVNHDILQLAALPYPSEARMKTLFSRDPQETKIRQAYQKKVRELFDAMTSSFQPGHVRIGMSHVFAAGGTESDSERPIEVGGAYTLSSDAFPAGVQYTALGHLHRPQHIHHPDYPVRYAGSPLAFSFSEAGHQKSVTMVDVKADDSYADVREIPLQSGSPLVQWKAEYGMDQVKSWISEKKDQDAWVELHLHLEDSPSMEDIQLIRRNHPGIVHIYPVFPKNRGKAAAEHKKSLPIDALFQKFYEKQTGGASPDEELVQLFMELIEKGDED